ncbi:DUF58 domain-containing protein [Agarilytica rhodophyticola]|uniref:DUF58 domain-containing protein n=1 Tax=Agarilytica rhodophyticola TaxID=1737490 RepID=UPI000B342DDC|nr:DUF58 domain-containing protein [Agarilytica rhodophyticola]
MLNNAVESIKSYWQSRFFRWLDRRNPAKNHHRLTSKNLYIFPTKQGLIFLIFVVVLWLLGTNYQNNLILGLTFLLMSIFVVCILHTYANLAGMELELKGASNAFAGENAEFFFFIKNNRARPGDGIGLRWQEDENNGAKIAFAGHATTKVHVGLKSKRRGVLRPKRLLIESEFPLGLLRCWTWLNFDAQALVYPKPIEIPLASSAVEDDEGDGEHPVHGGEDFSAFRDYRPGDPPKHVAWKLYARERGLFTKEFSQNMSREIWLDFFHINAADTELRLSALCFWALRFHLEDENYGLLVPGAKVTPNKGENHKAQVLEILARFEGA